MEMIVAQRFKKKEVDEKSVLNKDKVNITKWTNSPWRMI